MRKAIYFPLFAAILLSACNKKDPTPTPTPAPTPAAKVMFANACLNTSTLGVQIKDVTISSISLSFLGSSAYTNITPGTAVKTSFIFPSTTSPLITTAPTYDYVDGNHYSIFAVGNVTSPSMVFTTDDITAPASGKAKVRLINLSLDSLSYNFYVGGNKLNGGVTYKVTTAFTEVATGDKNVIIQDTADVGNQVTITPQHFNDGKIYTILVTGSKNYTGDAALKATVINNN